ncbi:hypothetical protein [Halorussus sp. AFM4]|uniref:hypothetical protein n=1 Tax=Halorussus sp. AFM4 TaxID=3421651 RepID=UPI003EB8C0E6
MSGDHQTIQTTRPAARDVERSMAKTEVALRNEEAAQIVEALRWYARENITPRKRARCEKLAETFESGFDI